MSYLIGEFKRDQNNVTVRDGYWMVLSLTQPWASALFIDGLKRIETRSWKTNYRGKLYIHASKGFPKYAREFMREELAAGRLPSYDLPLGYIIGSVELVSIERTSDLLNRPLSYTERSYGDYSSGRWGWITANPQLLEHPIPAKGQLGLWSFNPSTVGPNGSDGSEW